MKKKRSISRLIDIAVTATTIVIIAYFFLLFGFKTTLTGMSGNNKQSMMTRVKSLPPLDPYISSDLSYKKYMQIKDSIKFDREMKNGSLASSTTGIFVGAQTNVVCDSCTFDKLFSEKPKVHTHFITLHWWQLELDNHAKPLSYYVKDRQPYLRVRKCEITDTKWIDGKTRKMESCKEQDIKIPYFYNEDRKAMMIPVSNFIFRIFQPVLIIAMILFFIYFVFYIIGGFIKFLTEIAQGTPFSDTNVKRLRSIAVHLFLIPVSLIVLNFLMRLIFHKYFTPEIHLSSDVWGISWKPLILSGIFTALYAAFRRGKQLQDENDFTV